VVKQYPACDQLYLHCL